GPDTVIVSTVNSAPVAKAGADQTALVTGTVVLNGSTSTDVDGDALSFEWVLTSRPAGSITTLANSNSVSPTFVVDKPGSYEVRLTVHDGIVASSPDTVVVTTTNTAPVANAGQDSTAQVTRIVSLDGSGSSDVDGDSLSYLWSLSTLPASSAATLSNSTLVSPTFVVDVPGVYVAQLLVHDGTTMSPADTVTITTVNSPPTAVAGPDQSALAGQPVTLDGSGSSDVDNDPLTFMWAITTRPAGSAAAIINASGPVALFTADVLGTYVAQLIVNDGLVSSAPDTVVIDTRNTPPAASAGPDQLGVALGGLVQLDGSGSADADGHPLTFAWSLLSKPAGSGASISVADAVAPTFVADVPGDYVAQLIVHDGLVASAPDAVLIRTAAQSQLEVSPAFLAFPATAVTEQSAPQAVVVTNAGGTPLTFSSATVTGEFSVAANTCGELAPAQTCQIEVLFAPIDDGAATGSLELVFQSGAAAFVSDVTSLSGTGVSLTTVTVAATDAAASETGPDPGTFTITRVGDTTSALSVAFHMSGSAANGSDYSAIVGPVVIPAGAASATVTVTPIDDAATEEAESVVLTLLDGPGYGLGTDRSDTVTIEASGVLPVVTIAAADPDAAESPLDAGTFVITRTANLGLAFGVSLTRGGTALSGIDYVTIPGTVNFAAGQTTATLTVTPVDDPFVETPEIVTLSINPDGSYTLGAETTATVTIASEDVKPVVTITATDPGAAESPLDAGTFVITRTANLGLAFAVSLTRGGTALSSIDYVTLPGTVNFAAGQTTATLTVTPVNDALVEGPETVTVAINPSADFDPGAQTSAAVTIASEDVKPVVTITATDPDAAESPLDAGTFVITRTANLGLAFTVSLTRGGTALSSSDYVTIPGTVNFAAGQTTATLTVTPVNDALVEGPETVTVAINPSADFDPGAQTSAAVTIASEDVKPVVTITATDPDAAESPLDAGTFVITRTANLGLAFTVSLTRGGTALSSIDYVSIPATVNFAAGQTTVTLTVTPINDATVENAEIVVLTINASTAYDIGAQSSASVVIASEE
ncbi:MAG: Calx-beta domain-containing protein, partial [Vicinamibacterales bacterium]